LSQAVTSPAEEGLRPALPIMVVVFLSFMVIGMALPVLPLHIHDVLELSPFVVGLVAGAQFIAAMLSRFWAGRLADTRGPKHAMGLGLIAATLGGGCYLASLPIQEAPVWSAAVLLIGRALLGGAESLVITSGMLWGLGLVSPARSAKVIAWVGMAMFAAMAAGAPIGSYLYARTAFLGIAVVTVLLPIMSLLVIARLHPLEPRVASPRKISSVLGTVLLPGLGFAMSGITFGSITGFVTLYFATRGWPHGAVAFTIFALALIAARVVAGQLPDRFGGARVAIVCLAVQSAGLATLGFATSELAAMIGAGVAGAGFSLVFPSLSLEVVKRAPPENRGLAMGTYNAFLDLTLGIGSPALGWLASHAGLGSVFVASAIAAILAIPIAIALLNNRGPSC